MLNAYGWMSTDPAGLDLTDDPVGEGNDEAIAREAAIAKTIVVAWGNHCSRERSARLLEILGEVYCLGVNKEGSPKHPLYVANSAPLIAYRRPV